MTTKTTLGKQVTRLFFKEDTGYQELERRWAALFKSPEGKAIMNSGFHLFYQAIRGKNLSRSFGIMRRRYKSGMDPLRTLTRSYTQIREHFGDLLSASDIPEILYRMICHTEHQNTYGWGLDIPERLAALEALHARS